MPKYTVTAYLVVAHSTIVEADNIEDAEDLGMDQIYEGDFYEGEPEYQPESDVEEVDE